MLTQRVELLMDREQRDAALAAEEMKLMDDLTELERKNRFRGKWKRSAIRTVAISQEARDKHRRALANWKALHECVRDGMEGDQSVPSFAECT